MRINAVRPSLSGPHDRIPRRSGFGDPALAEPLGASTGPKYRVAMTRSQTWTGDLDLGRSRSRRRRAMRDAPPGHAWTRTDTIRTSPAAHAPLRAVRGPAADNQSASVYPIRRSECPSSSDRPVQRWGSRCLDVARSRSTGTAVGDSASNRSTRRDRSTFGSEILLQPSLARGARPGRKGTRVADRAGPLPRRSPTLHGRRESNGPNQTSSRVVHAYFTRLGRVSQSRLY